MVTGSRRREYCGKFGLVGDRWRAWWCGGRLQRGVMGRKEGRKEGVRREERKAVGVRWIHGLIIHPSRHVVRS